MRPESFNGNDRDGMLSTGIFLNQSSTPIFRTVEMIVGFNVKSAHDSEVLHSFWVTYQLIVREVLVIILIVISGIIDNQF